MSTSNSIIRTNKSRYFHSPGIYKAMNDWVCPHYRPPLLSYNNTPNAEMSLDLFNPFNPDIPSDNNDIIVNEFMQPPFETWVKNKLSHIFDADNQEEFDSSFDDLVSEQDGDLIFKGEKQSSRDQFKQKLWGEVKFHKGDVTEVDITEFPSEGEKHLVRRSTNRLHPSRISYLYDI